VELVNWEEVAAMLHLLLQQWTLIVKTDTNLVKMQARQATDPAVWK